MTRTPEQRAKRICDEWYAGSITDIEEAIRRAIRAAENAALERAANKCAGMFLGTWEGQTVRDVIEAMRTRAPRRRSR